MFGSHCDFVSKTFWMDAMLYLISIYFMIQTDASGIAAAAAAAPGSHVSRIGRDSVQIEQRRMSRVREREERRSRSRSYTPPFRNPKFRNFYSSDSRSSSISTNTLPMPMPMHDKSASFTLENRTEVNIQDIDYVGRMPSNETSGSYSIQTNNKEIDKRELNPLHQNHEFSKKKRGDDDDDDDDEGIICQFSISRRQKIAAAFLSAWIFLAVMFVLIYILPKKTSL